MMQQSIKKNTVYNAIKTVSSILFPLVTFPYISRVLLPENVGKINFGLSIVSYFSLIATLGIQTYAIRECSAAREDKKKLSNMASQIWSINIFTTVLAYVLLAFTLFFCHKIDNYRVLIIIQSLNIVATTLGADWLNFAMEDFKYITLRTVVFQIVSLILMFVFVHQPEDYMKYAMISLVSSAGANITNILYRSRYCKVRFTIAIDWKRHFSPIMFLFVMLLAQMIYSNLDITMLGLLKGDREVGLYSTAHKIMNLINQIVASLCWVILPRLSLYFETHDYNEINKLLRKVLLFNLTLGLPCVIGTVMLSKDMIIAIAGINYVDATIVLQVLMIAFAFMLIGGNFLGNSVLLPARQEKYYMIACVMTAAVNVVTNLIFIPLFGAMGAAITTAFSELVLFVMLLYKKDKRIKISNWFSMVISPIIGCIVIIVICMIFSSFYNLWLRLILSIFISGVMYFSIQMLAKNELVYDLLTKIKEKIKKKK